MKNIISLTIILTIVFVSCSKKENETSIDKKIQTPPIELLTSYMTGSFSSQAQSVSDSDFFDIRLEMIQIWEEDTSAIWLYVEQAAASALDKPYRQRIYKVRHSDSITFASSVYAMEEPLRFAGAQNDSTICASLSTLTPDSLKVREGCTVFLKMESDTLFAGATDSSSCQSSLRGASYATSEVTVTPSMILSWDRGFDSDGNQVWGAEKGSYKFDRID